jgi:hypothetical protein
VSHDFRVDPEMAAGCVATERAKRQERLSGISNRNIAAER